MFHFLEWAALYWSVVETKQRSLEELEDIFNDSKPVKRSLEKHQVMIVDDGIKIDLE